MTTLTPLAQLELELINRARMDPLAEAKRAGLATLNDFINPSSSGFPITADPKQVLAGNNQLTAAATGHLANQLAQNNFGHVIADGSTPESRIAAAGYSGNTALRKENTAGANGSVFDFNPTPKLPTQQQMGQAFAEQAHLGIFNDKPGPNITGEAGGHRLTFLDPSYKEVGIAVDLKYTNTGTSASGDLHYVENFGVRGTQSFLTGAVYNDDVIKDNFYSLGEAVKGVTVTVQNTAGGFVGNDTTGDGGGWSVGQPGGTYKVIFSAPGKVERRGDHRSRFAQRQDGPGQRQRDLCQCQHHAQ